MGRELPPVILQANHRVMQESREAIATDNKIVAELGDQQYKRIVYKRIWVSSLPFRTMQAIIYSI